MPRNIVLPDQIIPSLVRAAYDVSGSFGLLVEVAAVTGARYSQVAGLRVRDLQDDGAAPRLMMPSSKKGREKKIANRPVPIPLSLARRLRAAVVDRPGEAPLFVKESSDPWRKSDHTRLFTRAVGRAGIDAAAIAPHRCENVTIYALRHSSITRQLLNSTLARLGEELCRSPREFKAWSQNLGHDKVLTTFTSYGAVAAELQGQIIRELKLNKTNSEDAVRLLRQLAEDAEAGRLTL